jgi:hypothetical protein
VLSSRESLWRGYVPPRDPTTCIAGALVLLGRWPAALANDLLRRNGRRGHRQFQIQRADSRLFEERSRIATPAAAEPDAVIGRSRRALSDPLVRTAAPAIGFRRACSARKSPTGNPRGYEASPVAHQAHTEEEAAC